MLLTSDGLTNPTLRECASGLLGKPIEESTVAVVIDAFLPFGGDKSHFLRRLGVIRDEGWAQMDLVSLLAAPPRVVESRLREADAVYCYGGSNHWLAHAWTSTGLAPLLEELLEQKVYVGLSAGSMIFYRHHRAWTDAGEDWDEVRYLGLESVGPALPLFDWVVAAHLDAVWREPGFEAEVAEAARRFGRPVWVLDDDTGLLVRDREVEPEVVSEGRWLRLGA